MTKPTMRSPGLVREHKLKPADLRDRITPSADLFVLAHMGIPQVDVADWRLTIDGLVERPLVLSFDELTRRPKRTLEAIHQCAGSPTDPTRAVRQIANVLWTGVLLRDLLAETGIAPSATTLWAYGLDHGTVQGTPQSCYLKDLPLSAIEAGDALIATELNGEPLTEDQGYPARLVVPGFYGTTSVKWLSRLQLAERRADSLFTTTLYNDPDPHSGQRQPVWEIPPECLIVFPQGNQPAGEIEVWGWAWSARDIVAVEVSTDGGKSWQAASIEARSGHAWQRFSYRWQVRQPGRYELRCRARDESGKGQPAADARNAIYATTVTIAG